MIKHFINLEWKAFFRSASLKMNLFFKILLGFSALWMIVSFLGLGVGAYYFIKKELNLDPLVTINKFIIFYVALDLVIRYLWPVPNTMLQ